MAVVLDGTPVNVIPGNVSSFNIGPLTTSFTNGKVYISVLTNAAAAAVSSITGGSLTWTRRLLFNSGGNNYELWSAPVGGAIVNAVTFAVTLGGAAGFSSASLWAFSSNANNPLSFDAGGPQQAATGAASMTTSETAAIVCGGRFSTTSGPTASAPWSGIMSGVTGAFQGVEYQVAAAGSYTGLFSGTDENGSIIDAVFEQGGGGGGTPVVGFGGAAAQPSRRQEPSSFFGAAVSSNQSTPQYGPLAGTKAMDAFLVTVAPLGAVTIVDQGNQTTTLPATMLTVGALIPLSPSSFSSVNGGTFLPVYK